MGRIINTLSEGGIRGLFRKVRDSVSLHGVIYEYRLDEMESEKDTGVLPDGYTFKPAGEVSLEVLKTFSTCNREPGQFERSILTNLSTPDRAKGLCIMFENRGIVSLGWVYFFPPGSSRGEKYPSGQDVFYPMDGFVVKEHRGKGLHRQCVRERVRIAGQNGKKTGYSIVYIDNVPALKDNDKLGRRIGKVYRIKSAGKTVNLYIPSRWYLYFRKHI